MEIDLFHIVDARGRHVQYVVDVTLEEPPGSGECIWWIFAVQDVETLTDYERMQPHLLVGLKGHAPPSRSEYMAALHKSLPEAKRLKEDAAIIAAFADVDDCGMVLVTEDGEVRSFPYPLGSDDALPAYQGRRLINGTSRHFEQNALDPDLWFEHVDWKGGDV